MEAVTNVDHAVATALSSRHHPHGPAAPTKSTRKLRVQAAILLPVREALTSLHKSDDHSWHGALCCAVLGCVVLCCAALCCPVLPCAVLCCPVLPCAARNQGVRSHYLQELVWKLNRFPRQYNGELYPTLQNMSQIYCKLSCTRICRAAWCPTCQVA